MAERKPCVHCLAAHDCQKVKKRLPVFIFETMVFDLKNKEAEIVRYKTEEEAIVGHLEMLKKWRVMERK